MKKVKENKSRSENKGASSSKISNWMESKVEEPVLDLKVNPIIPGNTNKPESRMTPLEKMERLTAGISKKELEVLKSRTGLDYDKLANLLSVTRATLINKLSAEKFNSSLSERILGLADIYS